MTELGLRERSKARRRAAIVRAAFTLFAERGYHATTVADIAEAAEVAPRTIPLYFASKQDIALSRFTAFAERVTEAIRNRAPGQSVLDIVEQELRDEAHTDEEEIRELARRMFAANPELRALRAARMTRTIDEAAAAIDHDAGRPVGEIGARLAAVAMASIMIELADTRPGPTHSEGLEVALRFLRAGLDALPEH
ncbi:MAG TPA: helix-turn-helix domain-containing protein [Pseudonocardia sp.]|uniref:TetR/AcrR family transcriptional regulator n=1 Tax=Pseudonocardia sp. TaxID=60912 RepID=UPI002ED94D5E